MSTSFGQTNPDDVVGKVLRRAEVAKLARRLQGRLALASYKTRNGQENLSFRDVEARLEALIKRQRPCLDSEDSSTCSSSSSEHQLFFRGALSSPVTAPMFSDDFRSSQNSKSRTKPFYHPFAIEDELPKSKRLRSCSMASPLIEKRQNTWKNSHDLPQSSPINHHKAHFSTARGPNLSFASEISTIPDSPTMGHASDEEGGRLRSHSFNPNATSHSSPPRTPPPTRSRQRTSNGGEEGADLLLYLATSPSPANPRAKTSRIFAPSTPPSNTSALPSAMMHTPGLGGYSTPGQQFNFADFVNITPSPAQGAFSNRTPGPTKTPLAAREARKRLNFESLVPPGGSPTLSHVRGAVGKDSGLGMELGGELVS